MTKELPKLDGDLLRERRLELSLSEAGLSHSLGVAPTTIRRVEEGGPAVNYDLSFVARYAEALGVTFADMFSATQPDPDAATATGDDADDVAAVGSVIAGSGGRIHIDAAAEALDWPPERIRVALDRLARRLEGTGVCLVFFADTEALLAPVAGTRDIARAHLGRAVEVTGLTAAEFRVLAQLAVSGPVKHRSSSDTAVLTRLATTGFVSIGRTGVEGQQSRRRTEVKLTDRAHYDLVLEEGACLEG